MENKSHAVTRGHTPTVFVVDDDEPLLESLLAMFDAERIRALAFTSPGRFKRFYRPEMPGCLVLDICMPRQSGIELHQQLLRESKRLPVLFITAHADVSTAVAAMKSGAVELLEKPFDHSKLLDSVQKALALDAEWRKHDREFAAISTRINQLSDRDRETLELIHAGESNKSMAQKLFITERAVEMRRSAIMKKLQVRSLAELLELTITHRIHAQLRQTTQLF